ncbi:hypothetical protein CR513_24465, partial [Mucuna pruriens]
MPIHDLDTTDNNVQNGEQHNYGDQHLGDSCDVPLNDDVEEEQEMSQDKNLGDATEPPLVQLRRSNRQRQSSTRYTSNEYTEKNLNVTRSLWRVKRGKRLNNLNCIHVLLCPLPRQSLVLLRTNIDYSVILLELAKVLIDDNSDDVMTKVIPRGKFEACCEIAELAITST